MNIILTNDDGIDAIGLRVLYERLKKDGHRVGISAPLSNQSGKSQSINIRNSYKVRKDSAFEYGVDGTPADSVLFMVYSSEFEGFEPDVIISGINKGYNVSSDVPYSGTCGAAAEGAMNEYKAIAVSAECSDDSVFYKAAEFIAKNLKALYDNVLPYTYISVNVPREGDVDDWESAKLAYFAHSNEIEKGEPIAPQLTIYHNRIFDRQEYKEVVREKCEKEQALRSDCEIVADKKISVSIISVVPRTFSSHLTGLKLNNDDL